MVERGQKVAFVGQNGQGKSTLAKILVGELSAKGNVKLGHNVQVGYFAQNQAEYLDGKKTVLDTMIDEANEKNRSKVRDILGAFLFRGAAVEKYVSVLSGGERNRLALAKLLSVSNSTFAVLNAGSLNSSNRFSTFLISFAIFVDKLSSAQLL